MYLYDFVRLFPENDKSLLRLTYKKEVVFCDRVDYLQFNKDGMLDPICNSHVAFWYVEHNPIDPTAANRTTDGKHIIVPNIMDIVLDDMDVNPKYRYFNDIPDNNIKLKDLLDKSAWVWSTYVELIGEMDGEDSTDLFKTSELFSHMKTGKSKKKIHLPQDVYNRKVLGLDLSFYYIDPEKTKPDVTGKYTEPKPRLSIILEGSLLDGND